MPSGYTADIPKGMTFQTFAMNCARAFGACVTLRDEPGGGEAIPDVIEPSQYNAQAGAKARTDLAALNAMTPAQIDAAAARDFDEREGNRQRRLSEMQDTRAAYTKMLAAAEAWTPPTAEHAGLREFMLQQIKESIAWDCDERYYSKPTEPVTGSEWAASRRESLERDIAYHEQHQAEENDRAAARTAWIQALRKSLD